MMNNYFGKELSFNVGEDITASMNKAAVHHLLDMRLIS